MAGDWSRPRIRRSTSGSLDELSVFGELGLSDRGIAARLGVTDKTVAKAIAWLRNPVLG